MKLYAHPFSSYSQKVLIALYENATPFKYRNLEEPAASAELAALWPLKRFPVLLDDGRCILESSTIVAHLQAYHPGPVSLIPPVFTSLRAYRARLLNHPSIVRVVEEARPFRHYFPLGAPARD